MTTNMITSTNIKLFSIYLDFRSMILNYIVAFRDKLFNIVEIKGIKDNVVKSLFIRYYLIKILLKLREYINNLLLKIDSMYNVIEVLKVDSKVDTGYSRKIYENITIEGIINNTSDIIVMNNINKVYITYSLDNIICLKHLLRKYHLIDKSTIKNILMLNDIPYSSNSKVYMRYMEFGKIKTDIMEI